MKWLYKVVEVAHCDLAKFLNEDSLAVYGAGGWELVQILDTRGFVLTTIFKKLDYLQVGNPSGNPSNQWI